MKKVHDIERKVWTSELEEIHHVVDEELRAIRQMAAGLSPISAQTSSSLLPCAASTPRLCDGINSRPHDDFDDEDFDVDALKLKFDDDENGLNSAIPELYLAWSPVVDGGQSLSWYAAIVFVAITALMLAGAIV